VKYRYFRYLLGGDDPDAERIYRWHIAKRSGARMRAGMPTDMWKLSLNNYIGAAKTLLSSMQADGYLIEHRIPIDYYYELLGGSHRMACASALGLSNVPVLMHEQRVWAPPWDVSWFEKNGMEMSEIDRLVDTWEAMRQ
jgi:hypothetical protein